MAYLTKDNIFQVYKDSQKYMRAFYDPLDEYERIAKNLPHPGIDKAYPKVTDGTTSSIVRKTPKRVVQQIPTGTIKGMGWLPIVAGFIFQNKIIPNANEQNAFIDKCWRMIRGAMTYGASHSLTPFINRGDYFGTDLSIPYIKHVKFEAGKLSDLDSNCIPVEAWYQTADIEAIIEKEKQLKKQVKDRQKQQIANGEQPEADYESTWDLKELEEIKTMVSQMSDEESSKIMDRYKEDTSKSGVKLVTMFERGVGSTFYTIHVSTEKIVRTKKNKDPRGEIPVQTMYFETDGLNPLGVGIVEQLAPLQNLIDSEMQMYQFERALMLAPPTVKRGQWNKSQAKLSPNVIVDLGSDPNASWEVLKRDTSAINNFPDNYGLMKSQILSLASSPDASTSATIGNPGFSKTDSGVKQIDANVSVDDNYVRKQFETWFERWAETAINLYFAERTGTEELELDKDTASKLRQLEQEGLLEPGFVSEDDKIVIDYDSATEALKFEVDASTSNMRNDQQQLEALDGLLGRLESSVILQQNIPQEKIIGAWNAIVQSSGVENPEKLIVTDQEIEEAQAAQLEAQMQEQAMAQQAMQQPEMAMPQETMPEMVEPELSEEDTAFAIALQDMGYSDDQIMQAFAMEESGMNEDQIMEMLIASNG